MKHKKVTFRVLLTALIMSLGTTNSFCQRLKNPLYFSLELGGSGGLGSVNVERTFREKASHSLLWRAGLSYTPIDKNNGGSIIFPLMIHGIIGQNAHKLDLGIGQGITITTRGKFFVRTPIVVGYRYQPVDKPYYLRIAYTPLVSYLIDFQLQHWAGFTFGYTFQRP